MACMSFYIAFLFMFDLSASNTIINLSDKRWLIKNTPLNLSIYATVPGSVHTALLENKYIENPYVGLRDDEYAWIADEDWVYQTTFELSNDLLGQSSRLTFPGLDTVAEIILNEQVIGRTDNMFIKYTYSVKSILKEKNVLQIRFSSPTKYSQNKSENYFNNYGYVVPPKTLPIVQHGRNHQNFIRKEQCSFSWDWGPSFPTIGIWKDVFLEFTPIAVMDDLLLHVTFDSVEREWNVLFELMLESYVEKNMLFIFGFGSYMQKESLPIITGTQKISLGNIKVAHDDISLWWPRGYGNQTLYEAVVCLVNPADSQSSWKKSKFGFRTVELIQEPIQMSEGLSFYFKINSRAIFLKGANWVPADSFQERVSFSILENLFHSSIDANINTLRVWGGGVYEQDRFYQLADELGILIWQDLMFAVALYPVNVEFLESVRNEMLTQVRRLQHHACLIAWSGNNENEAAIAQTWWDEVKSNRKQLIADYITLYVDTIKPIIQQEDWTRPFVISSPSNGPESIESGYIAKDPQNPLYGDVHFYDYLNDCWNASIFPNPRFASEYGYQSYPSFITMSEVGSTDDLKWNSSLMYHKQHHANGNIEIENFIKLHYNLPTIRNEQGYFYFMIYLSQIVQATCTKYESEHYRRLQGYLINGTGHTMGALYWQLNDIWQAPSWSSIEYGGRWKMLHYFVKDFFAPNTITGYVHDDQVFVYYVTDYPEEISRLVLNVTVYSWLDFDIVWSKRIVKTVKNKPSVLIFKENIKTFLCSSNNCFIKLTHFDEKKNIASESDVFLSSFSSFTLKDPNLKVVSLQRITNLEYEIKLSADCPAAFVWLETILPGRFSNNGFTMTSHSITVSFYAWKPLTGDMLSSSLKVISLYDAYT